MAPVPAPVSAAAAEADDWRVPTGAQLVAALGPVAAGLWLSAGLCWLYVSHTAGCVVLHIARRYPPRQRLVNALLVLSYPATASASLATLAAPRCRPLLAALADLWLGVHLSLGGALVLAAYRSRHHLLRCVAARPLPVPAAPAGRRRLAGLLLLLAGHLGPVSAALGLLRLVVLVPALLPEPARYRWAPAPLWLYVPLRVSFFTHLGAAALLRYLVKPDLEPAVGLTEKARLISLLIDIHWLQRLLARWLLPSARLSVASAPVLRELTLSWITLAQTAEAVRRVRRAWTRPVLPVPEPPPPREKEVLSHGPQSADSDGDSPVDCDSGVSLDSLTDSELEEPRL
ncbi:hypothetical protein FJT64_004001 [Amphibalanus amphitrite]|uniref:Uncharacterized protein n=1 Tax=Amphibalanus amphitrite TaxID=1232801 RepID=A0A6A4W4H4_AMPAM|nr:hypothetical protein FJT64_004001 [Amphibalanus amphitrite]